MSARAVAIANPNAGSMDELGSIREALRSRGVELWETRAAGDAERLARRAAQDRGTARVIAVGGDGTLNEVLNGLAGQLERLELGLVPLGTGNDFARAAQVPAELDGALDLLAGGRARRVDVLEVRWDGGRRLALNASSGGFSTVLDEKLDPGVKEWLGALAYLVAAGRALPESRSHRVRVELDGECLDETLYNFVVANGGFVGGGVPVAPGARFDDGLAEIVLFPVRPVLQLAAVVAKVVSGTHADDPGVVLRRARRIVIAADPPMGFNADGEPAGETPVSYEVLPGAARIVLR
ncbi:MAG: diacylglycerol kinase family lipid kinase [Acidobacteria bacterium]|nr:diacylglycerol kinase family lipid kinase [Acidobacteriota bacterium]